MKKIFALITVLMSAGLAACKQQPAEAPAPAAQEQAIPPAPVDTPAGNPAETAAPAATTDQTKK
jgi:hypothetical protein